MWGQCFFDFKKAFDSVPHRALVDKLKHINLNPVLLRWILSYLSGRRQQVVVNGETSEQLPVLSGVPQGSVIGPLLFLIYIDRIKTLPLSDESHLTLYADDMLLYRPITSLTGEMQVYAYHKKDQFCSTRSNPKPLWQAAGESHCIQISWPAAIK